VKLQTRLYSFTRLSLNMDLFKAEISGEAGPGLGHNDVAAHYGLMEEEPAT
jgi:hypothetical protein